MKKLCAVIAVILIIAAVTNKVQISNGSSNKDAYVNSIAGKIIRFHVIANSDTQSDQSIKLKVRDKVLAFMYPKLNASKSIDESRKILKKYDKQVKEIAFNVLKSAGYSYGVSSTLSHENFPVKTYGNITLPQGKYEAYRIILGQGKGKNWWCVMFPPLCFVDITKGEVSNRKTESEMKRVLNQNEYNLVDNTCSENKKIEVKFKIVDIVNDIWNKLKSI